MKKLLLILSVFICFSLSAQDSSSVYVGDDGSILTDENGAIIVPDKPAAAWTPLSISGCKLWLKSDAGITKDGSDYVSKWDDQSGNGNHATQGTGANQPLWVDNVLNTMPSCYFDNVNDFLHIVFSSNISQPITIFSVEKLTNPVPGGAMAVYDGIDATNRIVLYQNYNLTELRLYAGIQYGYSKINTYTQFITSSCIFNTINSSIYENGTQKNSGNAGNNIISGINIGSDYGGTSNFGGYISEIIIYDSALGTTDRVNVENYLHTKYANY